MPDPSPRIIVLKGGGEGEVEMSDTNSAITVEKRCGRGWHKQIEEELSKESESKKTKTKSTKEILPSRYKWLLNLPLEYNPVTDIFKEIGIPYVYSWAYFKLSSYACLLGNKSHFIKQGLLPGKSAEDDVKLLNFFKFGKPPF